MILILEDDADRERYQQMSPLDVEFFAEPGNTLRPPTVWISPEAYAKDEVLAVLRAEVAVLAAAAEADANGSERSSAYATVLYLIDQPPAVDPATT